MRRFFFSDFENFDRTGFRPSHFSSSINSLKTARRKASSRLMLLSRTFIACRCRM